LPGQPGHQVDPSGQPGHTGFFLPPFFLQPGPIPARVGRAGFQNYGYIYLMHKKYEVFINSQVYKNKVKDQLGRNIKNFKSDCGREYMSDLFGNFLKQHSIIYQLFMPYTPQ